MQFTIILLFPSKKRKKANRPLAFVSPLSAFTTTSFFIPERGDTVSAWAIINFQQIKKSKFLNLGCLMKRTAKYSKACARLTFPHNTQEELYRELNRISYYWQPKSQDWVRDYTPANAATNLVKIRVWASSDKVNQAVELLLEGLSDSGLKLVEQSEPYPCRPPQQNDSRIYLTFIDEE